MSKRTRARATLGIRDADLPGLSRATAETSGRGPTATMSLLITVPNLVSITDPVFEDRAALRCWRVLAAVIRGKETHRFSGIAGLMSKASHSSEGMTAHTMRRGLRELVDGGIIRCTPDPSRGERLPD